MPPLLSCQEYDFHISMYERYVYHVYILIQIEYQYIMNFSIALKVDMVSREESSGPYGPDYTDANAV